MPQWFKNEVLISNLWSELIFLLILDGIQGIQKYFLLNIEFFLLMLLDSLLHVSVACCFLGILLFSEHLLIYIIFISRTLADGTVIEPL